MTQPTKIAVVGIVGIPACYGGFESLVENLTSKQSENVRYHVYCSSSAYVDKKTMHNNASLEYIPLKANGIQSIPYDIFCMMKSLFLKPDVTLVLGVSGCLFLPIYKFLSSSKVITNIDGLEWRREKWGKLTKFFLKFSESLAVKYSDVIITDNQAIGDYVDSEYGKANSIIAYGGDHVLKQPAESISESDFFVSVCRIEPENNVEMILEAFANTNFPLKFIGNWNSSDFGRKLKSMYSSFNNIELLDPIYDLQELYKLRKGCRGYVHGHSAGGTNPSLVEAMHFEKPVFAFDCDFNRYSTEEKAFYFCSSSNLVSKLELFDSNKLNLDVAKEMKKIAERRYTWEVVCRQYENTYLTGN